MAIDIQFLYRNLVDPNKAYESVDDFFDSTYTGTTDEEDLKAHVDINTKYVHEKTGVLTPDKKGVVLVRRFDNSAMYKEWKKQRSAIPKIDFNVSEEEGFFINIKAWGDYQVSEEEFN